jgi:uncharacterized protein GlcG (DUF336 family)
MRAIQTIVGLAAALFALGTSASCQAGAGHASGPSSIQAAEVTRILDQAEAAAKRIESLLRVDGSGKKQTCRMHIIVVDREGELVGRRSMPDAWVGSISIAHAKAFTALAFSSNENALTTRTLGPLTQPGGPLWNIGNSNRKTGLIEFPGGMPLYRGNELIGGIGVSGDGVDQDEEVAAAGAKGFEAPHAIRVDTVTKNGVPYTK